MSQGPGSGEEQPGRGGDGRRSRRRWIAGAAVACAGLAVLPPWPVAHAQGDADEDVDPPEDLMREHGVLKRVLLVYEEAIRRIEDKRDLPADAVRQAADIIRTFIEDYHEKLEEDYLFPRFEKAGRLADLTRVLRAQHEAGRRVTGEITRLASSSGGGDAKSPAMLADRMRAFIRMYSPHEAREDTVLFPAIRSVVSKTEFAALGEEFEKKERALFGEGGFEKMVDRVAAIEKTLGIYDLAQFTPR